MTRQSDNPMNPNKPERNIHVPSTNNEGGKYGAFKILYLMSPCDLFGDFYPSV